VKIKRLKSTLSLILSIVILASTAFPMVIAAEPDTITFVNPMATIDPLSNMALAARLDIHYPDQTAPAGPTVHVHADGTRYTIRDDGFWGLNNKVIALVNYTKGTNHQMALALGAMLRERYPEVIITAPSGVSGYFTEVGPPTGIEDIDIPTSWVRQGTTPGLGGPWNPNTESEYNAFGINTIAVLYVPPNPLDAAATEWVRTVNERRVDAAILTTND
jgi:hypothetical protein